MTCSGNTTFTPERRRRGLAALLAGLALFAAPALAGMTGNARELIALARADLSRGDGIAAEVRLRQALTGGAAREDIAAWMGEAYIAQGRPADARAWLAPGRFSRDSAAAGFRSLAGLERARGDLAAAGAAYDRALAITPRDAGLWVEIGRLRYAGAEHLLALEAADYALELDPKHVRALEFKGQIVRDRFGLVPSLAWFEAALKQEPEDLAVMGEYAATLGDLGRARDMLAVTRRMIELDPDNPRAFYLQAVLAARAGNDVLARRMLARGGDLLRDTPGVLLLRGVLELRAGNHDLAVIFLERLLDRQPANERARMLLARTWFLKGEYGRLLRRFGPVAARSDAPAYLLLLLGRAHEQLGERKLAAPLLDRAGQAGAAVVAPVVEGSRIGSLLADGLGSEALAAVEKDRAVNPGSAGGRILAGDVKLALGEAEAAMQDYREAARVRMPESVMLRLAAACRMSGRGSDAVALADAFLLHNPHSRGAARLVATQSLAAGDWARARSLLEWLRDNGGDRDARLMADLALAQLRGGDAKASGATASLAWRLQRSSPVGARVLAESLMALGREADAARALAEKAGRLASGPALP